MTVRIINADVMVGLAEIADESVDCIVTDPPYGETSLDWDVAPEFWLGDVRADEACVVALRALGERH